jgi:hypothetical protein
MLLSPPHGDRERSLSGVGPLSGRFQGALMKVDEVG